MGRLLILDDEEEALSWMTVALQGMGHEVLAVSTAQAALTAVEQWSPDLIIADILMPEVDGLTFARLVRRHRTPVMFVSIARKQAEAILCGAVAYVQKPATAAEVRGAVERVLGRGAVRNTILVVDDDPDVREYYHGLLEPRFVVMEAENGRRALELLQQQAVDLAIVDVHMPEMNGVELIKAMRADSRLESLPVIVQTGDWSALEAPVWTELHVSQVVSKVDFLEWLERRIGTHLSPGANGAQP